MGCREFTVGQAQMDEEGQVRTANLPLGLCGSCSDRTGRPWQRDHRVNLLKKKAESWRSVGIRAVSRQRGECGKSSQETSSSEEEMASGNCQHGASRRLAPSSLLCRAVSTEDQAREKTLVHGSDRGLQVTCSTVERRCRWEVDSWMTVGVHDPRAGKEKRPSMVGRWVTRQSSLSSTWHSRLL